MNQLARNRPVLNRLANALALAGGLTACAAQAVPVSTFELRAFFANETGVLAEDVQASKPGRDARAHASFGNSTATSAIEYGPRDIDAYVATFNEDMTSDLSFIGDTHWVAKIGFDHAIEPDLHNPLQPSIGSVLSAWRAQARTTEKYAVWAMAPNSVTGFAPLDSVHLGGWIQFYSDAQPLDFGNFSMPPFGTGPLLSFTGDFHEVLLAMNIGHTIVVDLDAAGVLPGEEYGFVETFSLNETAFTTTMFIHIDPVVGFAFAVPEPSMPALMIIGLAAFVPFARASRRKRAPAV